MARTPEHLRPSGNHVPVADETTISELVVQGTVPRRLSGQYARIGPNSIGQLAPPGARTAPDAMVHAVALQSGCAAVYRSRWIATDAASSRLGQQPVPGPRSTTHDAAVSNLLVFGGRILALADGDLAYELTNTLDTVRRVDLAGHARGVGAYPKSDPATGALHLISAPGERAPIHHVISPGGLTRTSRAITDAPADIHDIAITPDRLVMLGEGVTGVTVRAHHQPITWMPTATTPRDRVINAYDDGDAVVVDVAGSTLQRWTLDPSKRHVDHAVIDDAAPGFARINDESRGARHRYVYAAGGGPTVPYATTAVHKHDLRRRTRERHDFGAGRNPGEFLFVRDPARSVDEDGGWLIGLLHDINTSRTDLIVLDAADVPGPPLAAVHIPRRVPYGGRGIWIASSRS